ncbi:hypothetical protein OXYTRIMIC_157 [Oxytricha trifallax]|uniref:Uncharacterized protein n=1 Tax=Oxytricha trifallax TaxID=1172189 RepID=A0A073IAD5_9SPIT|nr:hypothetical protein OXYTRIMIC_157 [Oxytricha trifallax]
MPDFLNQIKEIDQRELVDKYFGSVNTFYRLQFIPADMRQDAVLFLKIFQQLYDNRNYTQIKQVWTQIEKFAIKTLKKQDLKTQFLQLGPLKFVRKSTGTGNHTYSQYKKQRQVVAEKIRKYSSKAFENSSSSTSPPDSKKSGTILTRAQRKKQYEEEAKNAMNN